MIKLTILGTAAFLFSSSFAFAANIDSNHNVTQQSSQKLLQLSDNDQPPGFQNGGHYPPGLTKNGKTPYGWSQGQKRGWQKNHGNRWNHHRYNGRHHDDRDGHHGDNDGHHGNNGGHHGKN